MEKKHIVLIGMPGSGKSTLGLSLSKLMGIPFIDTDNFIVGKERKSITAIFSEYGEEAFREMEKHALREILGNEPSVIATGGGLPCFHDNMDLISAKSVSVYLKVNPLKLSEYLKNDKKRPLVKNKSCGELKQYIATLLEDRKCFYERADITIDAYSETPPQLAVNLFNIIINNHYKSIPHEN